ncbi:MAG: Mur ligase family protein, partial [Candidatus Uhrbacteria bacterium]|nr:Mur ligase family protein [Candidatus Uhrbacteria bacterium]
MKMFELEDKTIVIFGFGREGRATFEVLSTKLENAKFIVTDEKSQNIPEYMSPEEAVLNSGSETIVIKSPGISPSNKFVQGFLKNGAVISSATNISFAERKGRGTMIGITGSKGKSTTASLLAHVLRVCGKQVELVGNIGEPAILHIDDAEDTIFVIELSSYQLSDLLVGPDVAVALNIFDEHMDYHGGSEGYVNAKLNITKSQTKEDIFFYHPNYEELVNAAQ